MTLIAVNNWESCKFRRTICKAVLQFFLNPILQDCSYGYSAGTVIGLLQNDVGMQRQTNSVLHVTWVRIHA